jgi:hypothetical protein
MPPTRPPASETSTPTSIRIFARTRRRAAAGLGVAALGLLVAGFVGAASPAVAAQPRVGLGTAASYAVLAGQTVTNTGPSVIDGDLGVSPGSAVTGFGPGVVVPPGVIHTADAAAAQAQVDLTTAYNDAAGRSASADLTGQDLGGMTLTPGVYAFPSTTAALTGALTLDAAGDPDAVFVFQIGSSLTTASGSSVLLIGDASPCNVYWQIGSSATLGTGTSFAGSIMALTSATLTTGVTVEGRVLARNGSVTLDTNVINAPNCDAPPTDTGGSATATPTRGVTKPAPSSTGKHHTSTDQTTPATPVIPSGHPSTGVGVTSASAGTAGDGGTALFVLAGLAGLAALIAALLAVKPVTIRRRR